MRRILILLAVLCPVGLIGLNYGPILDAFRYRALLAEARPLLPAGWAAFGRETTPDDHLARLLDAQTDAQREATEAASARFHLGRGTVLLSLPDGFDVAALNLSTGCFVHARQRFNVIFFSIYIPIGCT